MTNQYNIHRMQCADLGDEIRCQILTWLRQEYEYSGNVSKFCVASDGSEPAHIWLSHLLPAFHVCRRSSPSRRSTKCEDKLIPKFRIASAALYHVSERDGTA